MKITYDNKEDIISLPDVDAKNKVVASDMNEIKKAVNLMDDDVTNIKKDISTINDNIIDIKKDNVNINNDIKNLENISIGVTPVGTIIQWASTTIPDNWAICDGRSLSKTDYADLYSVIGDTYGSTSTTFKIPNQNNGSDNIDSSLIPTYNYIIRIK